MSELKPCPFCGNTELKIVARGNAAGVQCRCFSDGRPHSTIWKYGRTKEDAIKAWNTRPDSNPTPAHSAETIEATERPKVKNIVTVEDLENALNGLPEMDQIGGAILFDKVVPSCVRAIPKQPEPKGVLSSDAPASDLVERLHNDASRWMSGDMARDNEEAGQLSDEASQAITALQSKVDTLEADNKTLNQELELCQEEESMAEEQCVKDTAKITALQAENDAMREFVQEMIDNDPNELISDGGHTVLDHWRYHAKIALAGGKANG